MEEKRRKRGLPFSSLVAILFLLIVIFLFLSGEMYNFYGSMVFLFYSWTNMMWVSVIMLGVFQTVLLIPFRIIRLLDFKNIRDFKSETVELNDKSSQENFLKNQFRQGNWTLTFYLLDFAVQLTTYMTIGRLFLTDFYNKALNPRILYSFVPYPEYPIKERFFKIPYPHVSETIDLGWESVIYVWLLIIILGSVVSLIRSLLSHKKNNPNTQETKKKTSSDGALSGKYIIFYGLILGFFSYLFLRNFPTSLELSIFTGDVAKQNRTFNTVTAVATFLTLMWFGVNDILKKGKIAKKMGVSSQIINRTQKSLFKDKLTSSGLIALGAFFITNQIPCAFELSIFTLEVISLFSPFTLDRWILKAAPQKIIADDGTKEKQEVEKEFSQPAAG